MRGNAVYGAASLGQADTTALSRSLADQLHRSGLPQPEINLFPDSIPEGMAQANTYYPSKPGQNYRVYGLLGGQQGLDFLRQMVLKSTSSPLLTSLCRCGSSPAALEKTIKEFRVFTALHETSHMVAQAMGLNPRISYTENYNCRQPRYGRDCNIAERIADTSASLYTLSNFPGSSRYPAVIGNSRSMVMEPTHYTASSIDLGIKEFQAKPKFGLSIVETVTWASRLIGAQPGLSEEYDYAAIGYANIYIQSVKMVPDPVANVLKQAASSRAALFAPMASPVPASRLSGLTP